MSKSKPIVDTEHTTSVIVEDVSHTLIEQFLKQQLFDKLIIVKNCNLFFIVHVVKYEI